MSHERYIHSVENMRDIGGYILKRKKKLSCGKLIRSNLPQNLSEEDFEKLKRKNIKVVIDLRSKEEYQTKISAFENRKDFKVKHCPMVIGRDIPATPKDVPISYLKMLEDKKTICQILNTIVEAEGGVLYFCNAGKDRTGVITALIMMFMGAYQKSIIDDYLLTRYRLQKILERFCKISTRPVDDIIFPKTEFIKTFVNGFHKKYDTPAKYMSSIGFESKSQRKLRNFLSSK